MAYRLPWRQVAFSTLLLGLSLIFVPLNDLSVAPHVSWGDVFFMAAVFVALVERVLNRERIPVLPAYLVGTGIMFACWLINDAFTRADEMSSFLTIVTMLMLFPQAIVLLRIRDERELSFALYCWSLGGVIGALFTIAFCNGLISDHIDRFWYYHGRARGMTQHPNRLGLTCLMALPGLLLLFMRARSGPMKLIAVAAIIVILRAIDYSGARSTFVATGVLFATWGGLRARELLRADPILRQRALLFVFGATAVVGAVVIYSGITGEIPLVQAVLDRFSSGDRVSDRGRAQLNARSWEGFLDNPVLGEGYARFGVFQPDVAHNLYLQYLNAVGVLGFCVFLFAIVYPLLYPVRSHLRSTAGKYADINVCLLAGGAAFLAWLFPQSGLTNYDGVMLLGIFLYISVWRLYDPQQAPSRIDSVHRTDAIP